MRWRPVAMAALRRGSPDKKRIAEFLAQNYFAVHPLRPLNVHFSTEKLNWRARKPFTHHCISDRLSSPPSNESTACSSPFASPTPPSVRRPPQRSPLLVWRIRMSLRSTGPFVRASCPSCLLRTGSAVLVEPARRFPCLMKADTTNKQDDENTLHSSL